MTFWQFYTYNRVFPRRKANSSDEIESKGILQYRIIILVAI